jgi:hypothetical protein
MQTYIEVANHLIEFSMVDERIIDRKKYIDIIVNVIIDMENKAMNKLTSNYMNYIELRRLFPNRYDPVSSILGIKRIYMDNVDISMWRAGSHILDNYIKTMHNMNNTINKLLINNIHNDLVDAREYLRGRYKYGFIRITNRIIKNHTLDNLIYPDATLNISSFLPT